MSVKAALVIVIECIEHQKGVSATHQELMGNGVRSDMDFYAFSAEFGMSRSPQRVDQKLSGGNSPKRALISFGLTFAAWKQKSSLVFHLSINL